MKKLLPKGWVETELGDVLDIEMGQSPPSYSYNMEGIGTPFMQGKTEFGKTFPTIKKYTTEPKKIVEKGTVLLSVRAPIGPTNIANTQMCIGRGLAGLSSNKIPTNFILYYLRSIESVLDGLGTGTTFKAISANKIHTVHFPLPPLPEQERIVAKLDKLFAQHEKIKKALDRIPQLLKAFRQQVLTQAVTGKLTEQWREGKDLEWRIEKVRDVTNYNPRYSWDDQTCLSFVEMANLPIRLFSPLKSIKRKFIDVKKGYRRFSNSDVLLAKITPCFENGKSAVADGLLNGIGCGSSEYYVFRCKEGLLPYFLLFHFKRTVFLVEGADNMNGAVGQQRVTQEFVLNYEISIPPPQEQQEIVHRVESLFTKADAIEARYKILKAKIDSLPQAILHKAFKGELVPQLPTDGDAKDLLDEILALKKEVKEKKK